MFNYDTKMMQKIKANENNYGHTVYTRYADDIILSTNNKGACHKIYEALENIIKSLESPKLKINKEKTRYVSSSGGSALVTGLRICHNNHITLHKHYKDQIRLLASLYSKNKLKKEDEMKLVGHLAYSKHVDPVFYTKLYKKYFNTLKNLEALK
jgi:hypothetical protein